MREERERATKEKEDSDLTLLLRQHSHADKPTNKPSTNNSLTWLTLSCRQRPESVAFDPVPPGWMKGMARQRVTCFLCFIYMIRVWLLGCESFLALSDQSTRGHTYPRDNVVVVVVY